MYSNDCIPVNTCDAVPCREPQQSITTKLNDMREIASAIRNQQGQINRHFFASNLAEANKQDRSVDCFAAALDEVFDILREVHEMQSFFAEKSGANL